MSKRSDEQWRTLYEQFRVSGLSQAAFCKQHHLCSKRFGQLRRRMESERPSSFVAVKVPVTPRANVEVSYGSLKLSLPLTPLEPTLALIKALS